jgi:threonine dehydrogenase-like Zn-dependent dehydrogenase
MGQRVGLLPPVRRSACGLRDYDEGDLRWVEFIKCMRSAGLPIEQLATYVQLFPQGVARIKELTGGLGAHSVIEAVGTQESMMQSIRAARPGGHVGFVGVLHEVQIPAWEFFFSHVHLHGGPAPVRRYLPHPIELVTTGAIDPGKAFDLTLPLEEVAEEYRAMDERRAIKTLLRP